MKYDALNPDLFKKNRKKLYNLLPEKSIAIINAADEMPRNGDQFFPYRQNSDFFYLTGIEQEKSVLLIIKNEQKKDVKALLFIRTPNKDLEIWEGHKLTKTEARAISGIVEVQYISNLEHILKEYILLSESIFLNRNEYAKFDTPVPYKDIRFAEELKKAYPFHTYKRLAPLLTELRLIKEPEELEVLQKACKITESAFDKVMKFIEPGVKEYAVEAEITAEFMRKGAGGHAYQAIVASGKNSCVLHYVSNNETCKDGDLVLMDFGAEYANYAADMSRTVPVNGKFTERQKEVYRAVLRVLYKAQELIKPGNSINRLNEAVNRLIEKELVALGLAKQSDIDDLNKRDAVRMKYFMHGTSHFIGLDVHDVGTKNTVFEPGMLMSCEPGIYIEEEGFGIRLENDILVTENGNLNLFADAPIEPEDIERIMRSR